MKTSIRLAALIITLFLTTQAFAAGSSITAFWLDAQMVDQLAHNGAATLKVYAGLDAKGNPCYILVGGDGAYKTIGSTFQVQNIKGVCPPQCDFTGVSLDGSNGATITSQTAAEYIANYMRANPGVKNCAQFTMAALATMTHSAAYIKISLGTKATATGLDEEGAPSGSSATGTVTALTL